MYSPVCAVGTSCLGYGYNVFAEEFACSLGLYPVLFVVELHGHAVAAHCFIQNVALNSICLKDRFLRLGAGKCKTTFCAPLM